MVLAAVASNNYQEYKTLLSVFKELKKKQLIELILDEQGNVILAKTTQKGKQLLNL